MNIAFLNRDPNQWMGGDVIYVNETISSLRSFGYDAEYICNPNTDLSKFDLIHLVHCNYPWAYDHYVNAKKYDKSIVLSPIYHSHYLNLCNYLEILNGVDFVVCSSHREKKMLNRTENVAIISRGVSPIFYEQIRECKNYVFGLGRWQHKKQEHVIQACKELNIPYVGIGPGDTSYLNQCIYPLKYGIINTTPVYGMDLVKYYNGAKVVVIATDWEEFGFPLLEGGLNGCNLVATDKVGGIEWFPNITTYPYGNIKALKDAITKEYKAERNYKNYREYIKKNFLWDKVTEELEEVYKKLL
jgi:glycosyltransferase involved in cell wall biosynthesis